MERYLVIVSRDRPDLVECLTAAHGHKPEVKILLDRRVAQRREYGADRRSAYRAARDFGPTGFLMIQPDERLDQAA